MIWYKDENDGIIISTRIRLARNLDKTPFPAKLSGSEAEKVKKAIAESVTKSNSTLSKEFKLYNIDEIDEAEKAKLLEEHLISPQLARKKESGVLINNDRTMSIMLLEEDHIRLQIIKGGLCLEEAYDLADKVDDVMEEVLTYSFSERYGYLTACPTNVGTGLRASVMVHIPALVMTGNASRVLQSFSSMGIAVRGLYGEGTEAEGCMYQISNSVTLGVSEEEIISKIKTVALKIAEMEKRAREQLLEKHRDDVEDKIMRSYGILKYARKITSKEAKTMLSDCLLGQNMGIIEKDAKFAPLELIIKTAPGVISEKASLSAQERDIKRAELIRNSI